MTSGNPNTPPVPAAAALIVTPEALTPEQRERAEDYIARAGLPGLFVGALLAEQTWNIKPLLLDHGVVKLLRFSDPQLHLDQERFEECAELLLRSRQVTGGSARIENGVSGGQLWQRRCFYQRTLAEFDRPHEENLGAHPRDFALELLRSAARAKNAGIVHGHLCRRNIVIEAGVPILVDYGFRSWSFDLIVRSSEAAPELRRGERGDAGADVYGLGRVLQTLLADLLTDEERKLVAAMQDPNAYRRPPLDAVIDILFPGAAAHGVLVPPAGMLQPRTLKLGKVLGTDLEVAAPEPREDAKAEKDEPERSVEETLQWLKGTALIKGDVVQKIRDSMGTDAAADACVTEADKKSPERSSATTQPAAEEARARPAGKKRHRAARRKQEEQPQSAWTLLLALVIIAVAVIGIRRGFFEEQPAKEPRLIPYEQYWTSNMPSKMREVAAAAALEGDEKAELVIVEDALSGSQRPHVRAELLRIAFNARWEHELRPVDREVALKLALVELLRGGVRGLPPLDDVHPAVLLAVLANTEPDAEVPSLGRIPLQRLVSLPQPFGKAFQDLTALGVTSAADPAARSLARILLSEQSARVTQHFLRSGDDARLARGKLALLLRLNQPPAEVVWEAIKTDPAGALRESAGWFDGGTLVNWHDVPARQKALLMSGSLPEEQLRPEHYDDLLRFPVIELRPAVERKLLELYPPENRFTLQVLADQRNALTRDQTIALLTTLLTEKKLQYQLLDRWFGMKPDTGTVLEIVVARRSIQPDDPFSVRAAGYLKARDWSASLPDLKKLIVHQEALVRALAYAKLDAQDPKQALILQYGAAREPLENLRRQIRNKLDDVVGNWGPPPPEEADDSWAGLEEGGVEGQGGPPELPF